MFTADWQSIALNWTESAEQCEGQITKWDSDLTSFDTTTSFESDCVANPII